MLFYMSKLVRCVSLNPNMTSDFLKAIDSRRDIFLTSLEMLSILDLLYYFLPYASNPMVTNLNSILLQVNVPVLSLNRNYIYPRFSFNEHDMTSTCLSLALMYIYSSHEINNACMILTISKVIIKEIGSIVFISKK